MHTKPDDICGLAFKINRHYQPEIVSLDIKYHPVVCHDTCVSISSFKNIKIFIVSFRKLLVPI